MTHATIEVCLFLEKITFWMTGLLNTPQTRQIIIFFFFLCVIFFFVVYLRGHGIVHPVCRAVH